MRAIIIGLVSGIVSGTGMGGGTILIFLLTNICGLEQHIAQATNLIFFIPTSIAAIIVNIKLMYPIQRKQELQYVHIRKANGLL